MSRIKLYLKGVKTDKIVLKVIFGLMVIPKTTN